MVQIKTFRFNILSSCTDYNMHMKKQNAHDEYESLYTPDKIDKEINYFCKDKDVIDICKVIAEVRTFMPQEIKEKMSKPQPEMYLRMMNDDYENA